MQFPYIPYHPCPMAQAEARTWSIHRCLPVMCAPWVCTAQQHHTLCPTPPTPRLPALTLYHHRPGDEAIAKWQRWVNATVMRYRATIDEWEVSPAENTKCDST